MIKVLKRVFSYSLLLLVLGIVFSGGIKVQAVSAETSVNGASYYVDHTLETNELQYGVLQYTDIAYSKAGRDASGNANCVSAAAGSGGGGSCNLDQYYPQQVNVLEVPSSTEIKITPWSKMTQANWNLSTVKLMAKNYEELNPGYKVIAAINGDFFDINSTKLFPKTPSGAHVSGGEYYKSTSGRAISFTNDGSTNTLIGNATPSKTSTPVLAVYDAAGNIVREISVNKVNSTPGTGEIALYYANWALEAGWSSQKLVPINVENAIIVDNATYALPISSTDFYGIGAITGFGSAELNSGDFAVVSNNAEITALLQMGVTIRVQYEYTGLFDGATEMIGVGETLLYNNQYTAADKNRHPRSMVGVKPDGTIVMTVVDGRQPDTDMYGATAAEMASILKHYGCEDGYNLDGGGSSTMIILDDGEFRVMNSPSDGVERSDSNCLLVVAKVPTIEHSATVETEKLTINATIIDQKGINFTDLYVQLNGQMKKVEGGKAEFTGLTPNTDYSFKFFGYLDGEYRDLVIESKVFTSKRMPTVSPATFLLDEGTLFVYVDFDDPDGAIMRRSVQIGDQNIVVTKDKAVFENFVGSALSEFSINLSYDLNDGVGRIDLVLDNHPVQCPISIVLDSIVYDLNAYLKSFLSE
ncbi:MAG: phosphodiester glycosidase family protein [Bacilli bacterium]